MTARIVCAGLATVDLVYGVDRIPGARHVAITHGPGPVRWWSGGRTGSMPVPPVAAVDTAGAGDAFHGAVTVAVARDPQITGLSAALAYAVTVAGVRVTHRGPRGWLAQLGTSAPGPSPARS